MIAALLLTGVATASQILSVPDLVAHKAEFQGKTVEVRGWMGECKPLGCFIHSTLAGAKKSELDPDRRTWLSIGSVGRAFDDRAIRLRGKEVLLRGRFDGTCLSNDEASASPSGDFSITVCADRANEIQPEGPQSITPVRDR